MIEIHCHSKSFERVSKSFGRRVWRYQRGGETLFMILKMNTAL